MEYVWVVIDNGTDTFHGTVPASSLEKVAEYEKPERVAEFWSHQLSVVIRPGRGLVWSAKYRS